ncbi:2-C-methyl-D-erythritol 2,4-cyclodiphosphate synthase [Stella humosa]|uniref:Bifunctional enzyme IspD/IspF n=1 Tax=Stella humosa TaxID=94 RepID=A0A3N1ME55_9PROT|nr:bifunctional 2-C-methyl-D-erythritol 4-phosphate cytidylyltransferase/2-C-methyl-D-erythritol 2,4-cyclodiphosphate synthase [Stella humosa]ROQ01569.1 2-C-methyl-D-erythritol 2,4-cyclodiphosphate synthase [Stella humosa]BBK31949.1 bifunctional enzyme IspD/IspF [Stella humosa]
MPDPRPPEMNPSPAGATIAIVVAAGRGLRFGGAVPKQYGLLAGRPVLRHAVDRFLAHPAVDGVRVVIHPDDLPLYSAAMAGLDLPPPVAGGATRRESVLNGLESLAAAPPARVLIHDGARPLVDAELIDRTLAALAKHAGAVPAVAVADTLKRCGPDGAIVETVPRQGLWRAQTPQGFRFDRLLAAHRGGDFTIEPTDDAQVMEQAGETVALVAGSEDNIKITHDGDLARAASLLGQVAPGGGDIRVGTGFDVHAFAEGDHVWLGGLRIAHDRALSGHSDADVALHALTDAILGAIGAADIGAHFPPTDPQWRGASSDRFLAHAASLVAARGGTIVHVDLTIVCERPKVGPHRAAMVERIAAILGVAADRVSVKATTTEGLGFTGRREGIVAQAVATVRLP